MFTGKINDDVSPEYQQPGDLASGENMTNSVLMKGGAMSALPSSLLVGYTHPSGTNKIVGMHEDRQTQSIIVFVYNSLQNHRILRIKGTTVTVVASRGTIEGANLLLFDRRIHSIVILDNRLYWVDGFSDNNTIVGYEPRSIDLGKSDLNNKIREYEMYFGIKNSGQFAVSATYQFTIFPSSGGPLATAVPTQDDTGRVGNPVLGGQWIAEQLNASFPSYLTAEYCDCKVTITMKTAGNRLEFSSGDVNALLVPTNHYGSGVQSFQTIWAKTPPKCAPLPSYISNPTLEYNNIKNIRPQFRTRYIYDDGGASPWSAISILPLSGGQNFNGIKVDFSHDILSNPFWLSIIRYVEVAFRDGNDNIFRSIRRVPVCEIGTINNYIEFYNDANYDAVASDDLSVGSDLQVIMNDHNMPRTANTVEAVSDEGGNTRVVMGGLLKGYECPDCVEADFPVTSEAEECLFDIIGTVTVSNNPHASLVGDDPNFNEYQGGFPVYLAGTRYFAISNNPADGSGDGSFIIRGVPRGKYSLRVASHMCRYGSEIGGRYDLTNGIEWQKTSTYVLDVAGSNAANGVDTERYLDLSGFTGTVFDLDTVPGYGDIVIRNEHRTFTALVSNAYLYAYDNFGKLGTAMERSEAIACENQPISINFYTPGSGFDTVVNVMTDHNGFAWHQFNGIRLYACVGHNGWDALPPTTDPQLARLYAGSWDDIEDDTAVLKYETPGSDPGYNYIEFAHPISYYLFCGDPVWAAGRRRTDTAKITDTTGSPVSNALVWMFQHGRPVRSNSVGEVTITVFGFNGLNSLGALQNTYCLYEYDICGDYPIPPSGTSGITLTDFNLPTIIFELGFQGGIDPAFRYLKSGGVYKTGIVYEDDFGRSCGVVPAKTVYIQFHTEDGQYVPRRMNFSITSKPPLWAKRYRIVRTKDGYYQNYVHLPIADAKYVVINDGYNEPSASSYFSGNATHVMLQIGVNDYNVTAGTTTLVMFKENNTDGYRSRVNDRCRLLLDENQNTVITGSILDYNVVGEYIDGDKYYVIIPYESIGKQIKSDWVVELYAPRGIDEEIYYETGVCLDILNPGTINALHQGITQDQTSSLPATGPILSGDAYWNYRQYTLYGGKGYSFVAEGAKVLPFDDEPTQDIGRAFLVDPYAKEQFLYNMIQISGTYVPGSAVNNLSVFGSLDYIFINRSYGPIRKLVEPGNILLVICEFRTQPIYVSKSRVVDLSDNTIVGRSTKLLNIADEIVSDAGCVNPESVTEQDGRVYWWDLRNATVWQYGPSGVQDINAGRSKFFGVISAERLLLSRANDIVVSGFDREYKQFFLTFLPSGAAPARTPVWVESSNGWVFDFGAAPVDYASVANDMYIGSNTAPNIFHLMYKGSGFLSFLGTQYQGSFGFWHNENPSIEKNYHHIKIYSDVKFNASDILLPIRPQYPKGMVSRIPAIHWGYRDGQYFADFLRDQTDPKFASIVNPTTRANTALLRGRYLKGNVIRITLKINTPNSGGYCNFAEVSYTKSNVIK